MGEEIPTIPEFADYLQIDGGLPDGADARAAGLQGSPPVAVQRAEIDVWTGSRKKIAAASDASTPPVAHARPTGASEQAPAKKRGRK